MATVRELVSGKLQTRMLEEKDSKLYYAHVNLRLSHVFEKQYTVSTTCGQYTQIFKHENSHTNIFNTKNFPNFSTTLPLQANSHMEKAERLV